MSNFKLSRPTIYILLGAVVLSAYVFLSEETVRRGAPKRSSSATAKLNLPDGFLEEDFKTKFTPLNDSPKNSFEPIVARTRQGGAESSVSPDAVPTILTGGEANWVFTGMAEIDGVPVGLLENKATLEGVFLKQSESWKQATVSVISPNALTLVGKNGKQYVLRTIESEMSNYQAEATGLAPVSPQLRGPIGQGGVQVTPQANTNDPTLNNNRGGQGRNGQE